MTVAVAAVTVAALAAVVFFPPPGPGRAVTYVAATASGGAIVASGAAWVAVNRTNGAEDLVVCGGAALAVAAIASVLTSHPTVNTIGARCGPSEPSTRSSSVRASESATSGSMAAIAALTAPASWLGGTTVRRVSTPEFLGRCS